MRERNRETVHKSLKMKIMKQKRSDTFKCAKKQIFDVFENYYVKRVYAVEWHYFCVQELV